MAYRSRAHRHPAHPPPPARAPPRPGERGEPVEDWGSTRGHVHRFQSIVNSKGGKRYPRPSRLQPSRGSTPLLRTRHRCRTNPKTRQRTQNREGGWGSKTGRVGCGCHEDRRPRRRWTDANSLSNSHSRLSYWSYRKSAVREPPARRRRERCHEGSRWRPSPGSLAQPTTLRDRRPIVMSLSRTGAPLEVMSTHRFQSIVNCKGGKGPSTPACNPRATAHHCSARDAVAGPTPIAIHRRT